MPALKAQSQGPSPRMKHCQTLLKVIRELGAFWLELGMQVAQERSALEAELLLDLALHLRPSGCAEYKACYTAVLPCGEITTLDSCDTHPSQVLKFIFLMWYIRDMVWASCLEQCTNPWQSRVEYEWNIKLLWWIPGWPTSICICVLKTRPIF